MFFGILTKIKENLLLCMIDHGGYILLNAFHICFIAFRLFALYCNENFSIDNAFEIVSDLGNVIAGKGARQCVAAAKLGSKTALIAKLGADPFGDNYREHLRNETVNTEQVISVEGQTTGTAQISVADNGDNQIVIVVGANDTMTLEDVDNSGEFIDNAKVMVCQLESSVRVTLAALKRFKGIYILNASSPLDIFTVPNILCINEHEAASMTQRSVPNLP
ncbi:hypothetical protein HA402_004724 [Bradysia odoriphaga]|nr:hypothetical protein HA402_004724 [Bradysia odoriphaga]